MTERSERGYLRRDYLAFTASLGVSGLAGCSGDDGPAEESETPQEVQADEDNSATETPGDSPEGDERSTDESTPTETETDDPELAIRDTTIPAEQAVIGEDIPISVILENVGGASGEFNIQIEAGRATVDKTVEIESGNRETISASVNPMTVGTVEVSLNNMRLGDVEVDSAASENDRTVAAHYFSWYGYPHAWRGGKWSLESPYTPKLGNYDSREPEVIEQHIDWCHYAGIQWLNAVWTGRESPVDENLKNDILPHPRANELEWSMFYDTLIIHDIDDGSSVDLSDKRTAASLKENIAYLAEEYFERDYYKTIDEKPVLSTWLGSAYTGDPASVFTDAFDQAGVDPYFIVGTGGQLENVELLEIADAVTTYNPYRPRADIEDVFLDEMESTYRSWYLRSKVDEYDVIPTVIPGFNDSEITHVSRDNPVLEVSTDRYANACEVGHKYAEGPVFVTAFNEWYESTFIEPSEEFGTSFLEITADTLASDKWESPISEGSMVTLSFETTVPATEIAPGSDDPRDLTMRVYEISVFSGGEKVRDVEVGESEQGLDFVQGYFGAESEPNGETARWFGGQTESTLFFEEIAKIDRIEITGYAGTSMDVSVTVDGKSLGTTQITDQQDTYTIG